LAHRLEPHTGERFLTPVEIVRRLKGEFAFVDADAEAGQRDVAQMIRQFERMKTPLAVIQEHRALQAAAIHLVVADTPDFIDEYLSFASLSGKGLFIDYHSRHHVEAASPLLQRCCSVLGYEAHLE
jgi:hypothetical protein